MTKTFRQFETEVGGRKVIVETGKYAEQANGSCVVRCGDTVVMVNVTMSETPREGMDFFPLQVDFEEKMYAVGKIPGGFKKREGRASDKGILTSRLIDRPIRPLFPKGLYNDVVVIATALSVDTNIPRAVRNDGQLDRPEHLRYPLGRPHGFGAGRPGRRAVRHQS